MTYNEEYWRKILGHDAQPGDDDAELYKTVDITGLGELSQKDAGDGFGDTMKIEPAAQPQKAAAPKPVSQEPAVSKPPVKKTPQKPLQAAVPSDSKVSANFDPKAFAEERNTRDVGPDNFEVDFDFDGEYRDRPTDAPISKNRRKRSGCLGGVMYAAFIICASILLACLAWLAATDVLGFTKESNAVEVVIPSDYTMGDVADVLYENNIIKYKWLFRLYGSVSHADEKIAAGTYELNTNYDYRAIVYGLTPDTGTRVEVEVTIPEGYTTLQIFTLLEENGVCTANELWDTAANYEFDCPFLDSATLGEKTRLEGYLFPDTYKFYAGDSPSRVINKFLANFENKFTDEYVARAAELGYSVYDILKIASMIEREAGADSERDNIASVIYNRLKSSSLTYLQLDATIYYAIAGTDAEFSTSYDSPYNTYMYSGLTPTPIANPGITSIRAALYPASTDYYYYALTKDGTHKFFTNYDAHQAFVNSDDYGG